MKTLITAVEEWIDERVWKASRVAEHEAQFDANEQKLDVLHEQVAELQRRIDLWIDESDTARLDSVDSRLDDLECSMDEKIDSSDVDDKIESALADLDLPDAYSVEVMIDDALETKVMDAVRAELDATDFKITVER